VSQLIEPVARHIAIALGNARLLESAAGLADDALDRDLQIGPGTFRRIMLHIYTGELIWLRRWPIPHANRGSGDCMASGCADDAREPLWLCTSEEQRLAAARRGAGQGEEQGREPERHSGKRDKGGAAATALGDGRYHVVLPSTASSEEAIALATSVGAELVSMNPVRDTLEDFFLAHVRQGSRRSFD